MRGEREGGMIEREELKKSDGSDSGRCLVEGGGGRMGRGAEEGQTE